MLDKYMEVFPGIDIHIYSREDTPELYVVSVINKKVLVAGHPRERLISFHATITQVSEIVGEIIQLRNQVFEMRNGKAHHAQIPDRTV